MSDTMVLLRFLKTGHFIRDTCCCTLVYCYDLWLIHFQVQCGIVFYTSSVSALLLAGFFFVVVVFGWWLFLNPPVTLSCLKTHTNTAVIDPLKPPSHTVPGHYPGGVTVVLSMALHSCWHLWVGNSCLWKRLISCECVQLPCDVPWAPFEMWWLASCVMEEAHFSPHCPRSLALLQ